ncbi:MAG: sulfatase-like hydrolase/transferase, partial [Bacteroidaceae bacterium]|nr:sulfatase-like hydrolase/transferase [Bacteroidaceae bacterium]
MLNKLHNILNRGLSLAMVPIRLHPVLFLIGALLLFMPELARQTSLRDAISYVSLHAAITVCFSFAVSYMLCIFSTLLGLIKPKVGTIASITLLAVLFIYSFISVYVYKAFGIPYIAMTLALIGQTNSGEATEFLKTYISDNSFILITILYFVLGVISIALYIYRSRFIQFLRWMRHNGLIALLILWAVPFSMYKISTFIIKDAGHFAGGEPLFDIKDNQIFKDALSLKGSQGLVIDPQKMAYDTRIDSVGHPTSDIVFIIGESYNRHHSSLYGYTLPTCPQLAERNPYVFTDVISPKNFTFVAIRYLLSMEEANDESLRNSQLLCPIMKAAGYNVVFYSNQIVKSNNVNGFDMPMNLLFDNPIISKASFDYRNDKLFVRDGEFVDKFITDIPSFEKSDTANFTIIHLVGNHVHYPDRFPPSEAVFKPADVNR